MQVVQIANVIAAPATNNGQIGRPAAGTHGGHFRTGDKAPSGLAEARS